MAVTTYHNITSTIKTEVPLDVLSMEGFNSVSIQVTLIANSGMPLPSLDIVVRESGVLGNPVVVTTVTSGIAVGATTLALLTPQSRRRGQPTATRWCMALTRVQA